MAATRSSVSAGTLAAVVLLLLAGGCDGWDLPLSRAKAVEHNQDVATEDWMNEQFVDDVVVKGSSPSLGASAATGAASSELLPDISKKVVELLQRLQQDLWALLWYKPPVGIVALWTMTHLIVSGRLFRIHDVGYHSSREKNSAQAVLHKQQAKHRDDDLMGGTSRSFVLDADDVTYRRFGGIDCVRQKLVWAALLPYQQQTPSLEDDNQTTTTTATAGTDSFLQQQRQILRHVLSALPATCRPGCRRRDYVHDLIPSLAEIEAYQNAQNNLAAAEQALVLQSSRRRDRRRTKDAESSRMDHHHHHLDLQQLLNIGAQTTQMRAMDALMRICRDRLLRTTHRLARTVDHWSGRVEAWERVPSLFTFQKKQVEGDRLRLAYAKAAYQAEISRLGIVAQVLFLRPKDMEEQALLNALQATELARRQAKIDALLKAKVAPKREEPPKHPWWRRLGREAQPNSSREPWWRRPWRKDANVPRGRWWQGMRTKVIWRLRRKPLSATQRRIRAMEAFWNERVSKKMPNWKLPSFSKYSIRFLGDGSGGFLSVRKLESDGNIQAKAAANALLHAHEQNHTLWLKEASAWTSQCRTVICRIVSESLKGSSSGGGFDEADFSALQEHWLGGRRPWCDPPVQDVDPDVIAQDWTRILEYVDSLPSWRRVGEGKTVRLRDAAVVSWTRRVNVLGLPLAAAQIALANYVHEWVKPHWPHFRSEASRVFFKSLEIFDQRVWVPLKGIYDEIMNRSKGLMSGFGLDLEERSLDHMLRDMGYGDGTAASREAALEKAATQYEKDFSGGLLLNFASGRLVRLLLVQMQQLKVGMLQALDTIDVLMKGNQIHFQIMAAIPAVLIATYGFKLFVRALYNIRAKDLRPVNAAHVEMSAYLNQLDCLTVLLSSTYSVDSAPLTPAKSLEYTRASSLAANADAESSSTTDEAMLGEALFYMHRYLLLLDFSSWSVPSRASEDIHQSLRRLLEALAPASSITHSQSVDNKDTVSEALLRQRTQWMRLVKERHSNLKQYF